MKPNKLLLAFALACFVACPAFAGDGAPADPAALHAEGKALLEKGDLDGALKALLSAAQAAPDNADYKSDALGLKRIMAIRKYLATNPPDEKWTKLAISAHIYFLRNKVYPEALANGRMVHEKLNNAESASILAEVLLETDQNAEAVQMLRGLAQENVKPETQVCLGIALARLGKMDEAKRVAAEWPAPDKAEIGLLVDYARFDVLLDRQATALKTLTTIMEKSPPSQQELIRQYVAECKDFGRLLAHADFGKVMATESKVAESSCSSGTSCGTCPSRGACSSGTEKKDEDCESCGEGGSGTK